MPKLIDFMAEKLRRNVGKAYPTSPSAMTDRANDELGELDEAIARRDTPDEVWREAADVCNFALMAAALYEEQNGGKA